MRNLINDPPINLLSYPVKRNTLNYFVAGSLSVCVFQVIYQPKSPISNSMSGISAPCQCLLLAVSLLMSRRLRDSGLKWGVGAADAEPTVLHPPPFGGNN